jgi:hypothetical protein
LGQFHAEQFIGVHRGSERQIRQQRTAALVEIIPPAHQPLAARAERLTQRGAQPIEERLRRPPRGNVLSV